MPGSPAEMAGPEGRARSSRRWTERGHRGAVRRSGAPESAPASWWRCGSSARVGAARGQSCPCSGGAPCAGARSDLYGNTLIAKLTVGGHPCARRRRSGPVGFNLALAYMRFGDLPSGARSVECRRQRGRRDTGVGKGAVLFFRARCLEGMGEREQGGCALQGGLRARRSAADRRWNRRGNRGPAAPGGARADPVSPPVCYNPRRC